MITRYILRYALVSILAIIAETAAFGQGFPDSSLPRMPFHPHRDSVYALRDSAVKYDSSLVLEQNYPNPFKTTTTIRFQVRDETLVGKQTTLEVFDMTGAKITTMYDAAADNFLHTLTFDGGGVTRGAYKYRLLCADHQKVQLMNYMP